MAAMERQKKLEKDKPPVQEVAKPPALTGGKEELQVLPRS